MKKFVQEFRDFAMRGNVIDMAVGIVIGTAFGKIVSSLVADIIMPLLSLITGKINLVALAWTLNEGEKNQFAIKYGVFIQTIVDFILIAFSIFIVIKILSKFKKKEETKAAPPAPNRQEVLLEEIRDLLKKK